MKFQNAYLGAAVSLGVCLFFIHGNPLSADSTSVAKETLRAPEPKWIPAEMDLFSEMPSFNPYRKNIVKIPPAKTRYLRVVLFCQDNTTVAIDELEAFAPGGTDNIALASKGTLTSVSSSFQGFPQYSPDHITDGLFGNDSSWRPLESERTPWVQIDFGKPTAVDRISISRDQKEKISSDILPKGLEVYRSDDGENWQSVRRIDSFNAWLAGNNNDRPVNTVESVRRALDDMTATFGGDYPNAEGAFAELDEFKSRLADVPETQRGAGNEAYDAWERDFAIFRHRVLLANPLLDFDRILVIRGNRLAAPNNNFVTMEYVPKEGFDNELAVLSNLRSDDPTVTPFYRPAGGRPIAEPELHWDGDRVLFSSISEENGCWGVFEVKLDGTGLKTLTPTDQPDVDFYDACYVPDGTVITASTGSQQGLPCMGGAAAMVNLYKVDPATKKVRQLTFEQDSDWHPTLMRNGRVMYMRWEYTDMMHYFSRILFHMNPDGTNQSELYGSGSMFPTTLKHAREVPDSSEIAVILSGHHGRGDTGRLAVIDPSVARSYPFKMTPKSKEWGPEGEQIDVHPDVLPASETGFIQEIPGWGRDVVGNVLDMQAEGLKYNFIFPYPLSENYFLVNCQIDGDPDTYGLYLVDRFDNMTLIKKIDHQGLFSPIPIIPREKPPVIPDRVDLSKTTANVFVTNLYHGRATDTLPKGSIKKLRVFAYHFAYRDRGGHDAMGIRSGWDVKRILGEVPVEEDGSVSFVIPSNTPVSLQPLDEQGRAVQLMRSWLVGMPGENVSCNGCHESQLEVTQARLTAASRRAPSVIEPFYGPARSVTFETEVYYPMVTRYCVGCHDGSRPGVRSFTDARSAYEEIHPFVRRPGPETDMAVLQPMEYHASTSELCRMLDKGHYHVQLDEEAKRRLYCWIDMNAPWNGNWNHPELAKRRKELEELYVNVAHDYEGDYENYIARLRSAPLPEAVMPEPYEAPRDSDALAAEAKKLAEAGGWPFDADAARTRQTDGDEKVKRLELAPGVSIDFVKIPAGTFIMGSNTGYPDEAPRTRVTMDRPFWMSVTEVTNAQYAVFDPDHDTRYIEEHGKDHVVPGFVANHPNQPVTRISWNEAERFVRWLSMNCGVAADLPTEAEWEWAARAGSADAFFYGGLDANFSPFANLAGEECRRAYGWFINGATVHVRRNYPTESVFPLRDSRFADSWLVVDYVAQHCPNAWGLYDMIGNVAEWTKSSYRPYPYDAADGRNDVETNKTGQNGTGQNGAECHDTGSSVAGSAERKIARGGSWADRPKVAGSAVRYPYEAWQKVHNVGIRIILKE